MQDESMFSLYMVAAHFVGLGGLAYVMDWIDKRIMKDVE